MLMGDFNMNLLKRIIQFLDELYTNSFLPYINLPTRIMNLSETLKENIFCNKTNPEATARNITTQISDHFMQFLIQPSPFISNCEQTTKTLHCYKSFDKEQFRNDLSKIDQEHSKPLN